MKKAIRIHAADNVAVALMELRSGMQIEEKGFAVKLLEDIPQGHKFAVSAIAKGDSVRKYGMPIGEAMDDIMAGQWIHTHNLRTSLTEAEEYQYHPLRISAEKGNKEEKRYFWGYQRPALPHWRINLWAAHRNQGLPRYAAYWNTERKRGKTACCF